MAIQGEINRLIGTAGVAVTLANKLGSKPEVKNSEVKEPSGIDAKMAAKLREPSGIDAKMAAKARRTAQQKINTIYANKDLSNKAKTRRMGQVIDEYNNMLGGSK